MARLNISVPDALYARLDRLRDRVNASKVCAAALEKELDIVDGATAVTDTEAAKVSRLVERLQQQRDERTRWFQRGRQAGEAWAMETASVNELAEFEETWVGLDTIELARFQPEDMDGWEDVLPESFRSGETALSDEVLTDQLLRGAYILGWHHGVDGLWRAARGQLG